MVYLLLLSPPTPLYHNILLPPVLGGGFDKIVCLAFFALPIVSTDLVGVFIIFMLEYFMHYIEVLSTLIFEFVIFWEEEHERW